MAKNRPKTFAEAFERERLGTYEKDYEFDDSLWRLACEAVAADPEFKTLPEPLVVYYATRYLEWEVGNGGFAQAAMNIPQLFEVAARGHEILGKPELAAFIREAAILAKSESQRIAEARGTLEDAFAYFREGVFDDFDNRLDQIGWWKNDPLRLLGAAPGQLRNSVGS